MVKVQKTCKMQGCVGANQGILGQTALLPAKCANTAHRRLMGPLVAFAYRVRSEKMDNLLAYHVPKTPRAALEHRSASATRGTTPRTALLLARLVQLAHSTTTWVLPLVVAATYITATMLETYLVMHVLPIPIRGIAGIELYVESGECTSVAVLNTHADAIQDTSVTIEKHRQNNMLFGPNLLVNPVLLAILGSLAMRQTLVHAVPLVITK